MTQIWSLQLLCDAVRPEISKPGGVGKEEDFPVFRGQGRRKKPAKETKKGSPGSQKGNRESVIFGNQEKIREEE